MKIKFLLCCLFVLLLFNSETKAQKYDFFQSAATYASLTDLTKLIGFDSLQVNHEIGMPIPFTFEIMGHPYTSLTLGSEGSGYGSNSNPPQNDGFTAMGTRLTDKDSTSGIYYKTEGSGTNHIFKLEYINANTAGGPANWQVWLYETTNVIEVRFGPNSVTNAAALSAGGPALSVWTLDFTTFKTTNLQTVSGDPASPEIKTTLKPDQSFYPLTAMPTSGTVYRFTPKSTSNSIWENTAPAAISMYPNPAKQGQEVILRTEQPNTTVNVTDMTGKLVFTASGEDSVNIPTAALAKGVYFITLANSATPAQKLIVE